MSHENGPRTFISYSRQDSEFALQLARELRSEGFNIWFDQLDIRTGARWDDEIEAALEESEIFMVILTPDSSASDNVKDEIGYAIDTGSAHCRSTDGLNCLPNLLRIVFDPARRRIMLCKLELSRFGDLHRCIKHNRTRAARALINRKNMLVHRLITCSLVARDCRISHCPYTQKCSAEAAAHASLTGNRSVRVFPAAHRTSVRCVPGHPEATGSHAGT